MGRWFRIFFCLGRTVIWKCYGFFYLVVCMFSFSCSRVDRVVFYVVIIIVVVFGEMVSLLILVEIEFNF